MVATPDPGTVEHCTMPDSEDKVAVAKTPRMAEYSYCLAFLRGREQHSNDSTPCGRRCLNNSDPWGIVQLKESRVLELSGL